MRRRFQWGEYFFGCQAILFTQYMFPGCYDNSVWALLVLPILVAFFWIREA